jgi:hypothetical protein
MRLWRLRTNYEEHHGRAYDENHIDIDEGIKTDPKKFFKFVDLMKKRIGYPYVMSF